MPANRHTAMVRKKASLPGVTSTGRGPQTTERTGAYGVYAIELLLRVLTRFPIRGPTLGAGD